MRNFCFLVFQLFVGIGGYSQSHEVTISPHNDKNGITENQYELIYDKIKRLPHNAQVAIALIEKGAVTFFGVKREHGSARIINNRTAVFEIGSITKVLTSTVLAHYVLQNEIQLDNSISAHLDFQIRGNVKISYEQLATHTSGLPRVPPSLDSVSLVNPYKDFGEDALKTYLRKKLNISQDTGKAFEYSNLGGGLLGYVLCHIEQISYEDMLQRHIFSKYGMEHSTTDRYKIRNSLIRGLNEKGEEVPNWDMAVLVGAGGVLSTAEDLAKFALAQFDPANHELALTRRTYYHVNENFSMGLGWSIISSESGAEWNWHNGGTGGYTSSMILDTTAQNGVIILSNITALGSLAGEIMGLSSELMKTLE